MAVQEPEGQTIQSAESKRVRNRSARALACLIKPWLKAGWPQQVWSRGYRTLKPEFFKRAVRSRAAWGKKTSIRQGMKRVTELGKFDSIT